MLNTRSSLPELTLTPTTAAAAPVQWRVSDALVPYEAATGWVAVSECSRTIDADQIRRESGKPSGPYDWLEGRPYTRVGRSIRLYDIRPASP